MNTENNEFVQKENYSDMGEVACFINNTIHSSGMSIAWISMDAPKM